MRLIDDEQRRLRVPDGVDHLGLGQLLGGEEEELERVLGQLGERRFPLGGRDGRVDLRRPARRAPAQVVDLVARTLQAPTELPLSIVTAMVGVPFFLWLLRKRSGETVVGG